MTERNYYDILGLTPDADGTAVNRTYWLLARRYQGEATNDPRANQRLDELNAAYAVLGTPVLRDAYDAAHPAGEIEPRSAALDDRSPPRRFGSVRRGSAREASDAGRAAPGFRAFAPYAMMIALAAVGVSLGFWSGSLLLATLGTCGALVAGVTLTRHKLVDLARGLAFGLGTGRAESAGEPAPEPGRASDEPRSTSIARPRGADEPLSGSIVRRGGIQADELRLSTASMVGRWRSSVRAAAATEAIDAERGPDSTLVDIFRSEQELESPSEPLSAVLDVLRGSRRPG